MMNELHRPDDEHFFFRQEMRCEGFLKSGSDRAIVQGFGWISDYGYGVTWPMACLAMLWGLPLFFYAAHIDPDCWRGPMVETEACLLAREASFTEAMGFSFSSLFGFLGLQRLHFLDMIESLPAGLRIISVGQTILGFVFLFFLGLGLRNRFRLK